MATYDETRSRADSGFLFALLSAALHHAAARFEAMRHRREVAQLLVWDQRMLRDIGVTEGDVRSAMASRFGEDPSSRLEAMAGERRRAFLEGARERAQRQRTQRGRR